VTVAPPGVIVAMTSLFVASCVASDLRTRRIPNALTGPAILAGFALNTWSAGWSGVQMSAAGFGLAMALLLAPFAAGGIGGGDVKMMGAIGALLGPWLVLLSLGAGLTLGGVFAVIHLARIGRLRDRLENLRRMIANAVLAASLKPLYASADAPGAVALPYSLPLGIGTVCVLASTLMGQT
jgi:prepilin peptidase CpaA